MAGTATAATALTGVQTASATTDRTLRLPAPTGRRPVGTTTRALTDTHRSDPWNSAPTRELALTVCYPAAVVHGFEHGPRAVAADDGHALRRHAVRSRPPV
jgi:hypothetical protein